MKNMNKRLNNHGKKSVMTQSSEEIIKPAILANNLLAHSTTTKCFQNVVYEPKSTQHTKKKQLKKNQDTHLGMYVTV